MNGHELGAVGECALHLDLDEHRRHAVHDVRPSEDAPSKVHELRDGAPLANQFQDLGGQERSGFRVIEA